MVGYRRRLPLSSRSDASRFTSGNLDRGAGRDCTKSSSSVEQMPSVSLVEQNAVTRRDIHRPLGHEIGRHVE